MLLALMVKFDFLSFEVFFLHRTTSFRHSWSWTSEGHVTSGFSLNKVCMTEELDDAGEFAGTDLLEIELFSSPLYYK